MFHLCNMVEQHLLEWLLYNYALELLSQVSKPTFPLTYGTSETWEGRPAKASFPLQQVLWSLLPIRTPLWARCGKTFCRRGSLTASPTFFSVSLSVDFDDRAFTLNLMAKRIRGASKFQSWNHLKLFLGEVVMHTYDLSVVHAKIFSVKILFMARHQH